MDRQQLAQQIFQTAHLTGEFKLRSGQISNEYFDKYRFEAQPQLLKKIAEQMKTLIPSDSEILAGLEMGGIPIATALSFTTNTPTVFVRKQAKDYGTCKLAEGSEIEGKKLCIIEDVITTGGAVIDAVTELRKRGATVTDVVCVIYRGQGEPQNLIDLGLKVHPLFTMQQLKES